MAWVLEVPLIIYLLVTLFVVNKAGSNIRSMYCCISHEETSPLRENRTQLIVRLCPSRLRRYRTPGLPSRSAHSSHSCLMAACSAEAFARASALQAWCKALIESMI